MAKRNFNKEVVEEVKAVEEPVEVEAAVAETPVVEEKPAPKASKKVKIVRCEMLNIRANDSKTSDVVAVLPKGTTLEVIDRGDEWTKVKTSSGAIGFVMSDFISK